MKLHPLLHGLHVVWLLGLLNEFWIEVASWDAVYSLELGKDIEQSLLVISVLSHALDQPQMPLCLTKLLSQCIVAITPSLG